MRLKFKCPVCGYLNGFVNSTVVQDRTGAACKKCEATLVFSIEPAQVFVRRTGIGRVTSTELKKHK
jgi:hypothetical protein